MKNYKDEEIYVLVDILSFVFVGLSLYSFLGVVNQYLNGDFGILILILMGLLLLLMIFSFSYISLFNIINALKNIKIVEEIKTKGVKVSGEIIEIIDSYSYEYKNTYFKRASYWGRNKLYYYAIVKYRYNKQVKFVKTPSLNFLPDDLISNDVDVFIYNDKYYIDNFKIKK